MGKGGYLPFTGIRIGRFMLLLISISLLFTLRPLLEGIIGIRFLMDIFVTVILLSGIYAASPSKKIFRVSLMIALPTIVSHWVAFIFKASPLFLISEIFSGIFFAFMVGIILHYLFAEKNITTDVLAAAVCAYFMIGLMWSAFYAIIEIVHPGSFNVSQDFGGSTFYFTYYSFVTLTTLGYGDITPVTAVTKSFSLLEAVTGQIYIATLLARLVSINIMQSMQKGSS
jgi:voltage-gated potassium channel Kch